MRAVLRQVPADDEVLLVEGRAELEDVALLAVRGDNFRKVVVTGDPYEKPWTDRNGVTFIGIMPFLLDPKSLETL